MKKEPMKKKGAGKVFLILAGIAAAAGAVFFVKNRLKKVPAEAENTDAEENSEEEKTAEETEQAEDVQDTEEKAETEDKE